ncbi:MAG: hypothetical protein ABWZ77_07045 [Naasia sp.]
MSAYTPAIGSGFATGRVSATRPPLRITRRGKVVLAVLLTLPTAAVIGVMSLSSAPAVATSAASDPTAFDYVTVSAGESLWDVAERIAPTADPRDVIADIERLNGLESSGVAAGESLAVPAAYSG